MTIRAMGAPMGAAAIFAMVLCACDSGDDAPQVFFPPQTVIPGAQPATAAPVAPPAVPPAAPAVPPAAPAAPPAAPAVPPAAPAVPPAAPDVPPATPPVTPEAGAPAPPPPAEPAPDQGEGDGSDVVTIGDSWMNLGYTGGGIEGAFRRAGKSYRGYAVAGTTLGGSIPGQYDRAKRAGSEITTVIMTGGGNDLMFGGCNSPDSCAATIQGIRDTLSELWTQMADDGVKDVVYIQYSASAGTTNRDNLPDEPRPPIEICLSGRIRCHTIETTDAVMGSLADGIHPTSAANDRIAAKTLEYMEKNGIRR